MDLLDNAQDWTIIHAIHLTEAGMIAVRENVTFDQDAINGFCQRWQVVEMSLFGSVLRDDFGPESDVDVLVVFSDDAPWSYWDWAPMTDELSRIFGRPVDLVEKRSVVNPYRRHHILTNRRVIHNNAS